MFFRSKKSSSNGKGDWVTDLTETIEGAIDQVRDKAVVPLITVARILVYGLLAAIVGTAAIVLFTIALMRVLYVYTSNIEWFENSVWIVDAAAGAIFVLIGLLLWGKSKSHVRNTAK